MGLNVISLGLVSDEKQHEKSKSVRKGCDPNVQCLSNGVLMSAVPPEVTV